MRNLAGLVHGLLVMAMIAVMCLIFATAMAGEARVFWTPPTQRVDGTPLSADDGLYYRVSWGQASRGYTETADTEASEHLVTDLGAGTWYFAVQAIDSAGLVSAFSNEGTKTFASSPPLPPSLTVQDGAQAAYGLVQSTNRMALIPVGIVPPGTECDAAQSIRDANGVQGYVVPRESVQWAGTVRPRVVVAQCG